MPYSRNRHRPGLFSSLGRDRSLFRGLIVATAAVLLSTSLAASPSSAKTVVGENEEGHLVITVPVSFVPVDGVVLTEARLGDWARETRQEWNQRPKGGFWYFCGRRVVIEPDFQLFADGHDDRNLVRVENRPSSETLLVDDPSHQIASGVWTIAPDPKEIAHEVGHFLGLGDEYTEVRQNDGTVKKVPSSAEAARSLMGSPDGEILPRNMRELLEKNHHPPCDLRIDIDETLNTGVSGQIEHYHWILKSDLELELLENGSGGYDLEDLDGNSDRLWKAGDACRVINGVVPQHLDPKPVQGQRAGTRIQLTVEIGVRDREDFEVRVDCGGAAFSGKVPAMGMTSRFPIEGDIHQGRLELSEQEDHEVLLMTRRIVVTSPSEPSREK